MEKKSAMDIFVAQQAVSRDDYVEVEESVEMPEEELRRETMASPEAYAGTAPFPPSVPSGPSLRQKTESAAKKARRLQINQIKTSEDLLLAKEPIKVRETGSPGFRRVIVPPNVYVVHTRTGVKKPVNIGLGISFRYRPNTDAYLVIPAAMQTIGVVANCISKEKQGINILAYVQWQINDISVAYKKLDFSDTRDPLGIVNAQLREQAEAAIKDKISTMSVEEVLTDKAPIIEELTLRLKLVAEGQRTGAGDGGSEEGLGIKIITVQIREALVSSETLWTDLQSHFRYEQKKGSRISYLSMEQAIKTRELESRKNAETSEAEAKVEIERIKQQKETEALQLRLKEEAERFRKQQESIRERTTLEEETAKAKAESRERLTAKENELKLKRELEILKQANDKTAEETRLAILDMEQQVLRMEKETAVREAEAAFKELLQKRQDELDSLSLSAKLDREKLTRERNAEFAEAEAELKYRSDELAVKIERMRQEINNLRNERVLFHELIEELPRIAGSLPEIKELKILQSGGDGGGGFDMLADFVTKTMALAEHLGIKLPGKGKPENE